MRKVVNFLMDGNFCYSIDDYNVLDLKSRDKPKRLLNHIFAHNGFGFDYKFLYEDLN